MLRSLCFAALLLAARTAAAQSTTSRFVLTYDPSSEDQRQALAAVRAHIRGLPVELVAEAVEQEPELAERLAASGALAGTHRALGTFSIEQGKDRSILVFFTEPGGTATLVRRLPGSEPGARVAIEQAAIVVRSLIEALLEGGRVGVVAADDAQKDSPRRDVPARPKTETSAPDAETPTEAAVVTPLLDSEPNEGEGAARSVPPLVFLFVGYAGTHPGGGLSWQSGAAAGVRWSVGPTAYLGARYTLIPASEVEAGSTRISLKRRPAELLFGFLAGTWILANAELSVIAEQSSRETLETDAAFEPTPSSSHWGFGVGPRVGAIVAPWAALELAVRAGADFLLTQRTYATDERSVSDPARIRPRLEFEAGVGIW